MNAILCFLHYQEIVPCFRHCLNERFHQAAMHLNNFDVRMNAVLPC